MIGRRVDHAWWRPLVAFGGGERRSTRRILLFSNASLISPGTTLTYLICYVYLNIGLSDNVPRSSPFQMSFNMSTNCKSRLGKSPRILDLIVCNSRYTLDEYDRFSRCLSRIGDSELVQIVQAVGLLPGLSSVHFSFSDHRRSDSSESLSLKIDHEADCVIDRLLPVLRESLCSQASSQLKKFYLQTEDDYQHLISWSCPRQYRASKVLKFLKSPVYIT